MKMITLLAATLLASGTSLASAQPAPPSHEQHQATGQHEADAGEQGCCCERMMKEMHKMMSEMKQMHQGMAAHSGHDAAKDKPQDQPKR